MPSYRKSHIKNKIHKIKPRRSIFKRLWFWVLLFFIIFVLSAVYLVIFWSGFEVKNVVISGNDKIDSKELQETVLSNSTTGLVKFWNLDLISRSIILLNTDKLDKQVLEKFPLIEKIFIDKRLPQTLALQITERKPLGVYCSGQSGNNQQCFLIDQNGVIFESLGTVPGDFVIVRQVLQDNNLYTGESVITQNAVDAISKIQKDLKDDFQINIKEALITSSLRLDVKTDGGWEIYLNLGSDPDIGSQITKLNLLLNDKINSDIRKTLQYIDLRFKDRAYYK